MDRESARQEIRSSWRQILFQMTKPAKQKVNGEQSYICPLCGNGIGKKGDGLTYNPKSKDGNGLKCFKCGFSGDIIDLYQQVNNTNYNDAFSSLANELNITVDPYRPTPAAGDAQSNTVSPEGINAYRKEKTGTEAKIDYTEYYNECRDRIHDPAAAEYLEKRGISLDTAAAYLIGYDQQADPAHAPGGNGKAETPAPRIIIPITQDYYIGRRIDENTKFAKVNSKGSKIELFNEDVLYTDDVQKVFVVEGIFDALSILEAGATAIALNSTSNVNMLIEKLAVKATNSMLIICLDNDASGKKATDQLTDRLQRLNIDFITADICGEYKDPNEYLQKDKDGFVTALYNALEAATPKSEIDIFLESTYTEKYKPTPTGIKDFDKILHGGLIPQTLTLIGAAPGAGKTSFTTMIFENLARAGLPGIYFNLEMSKEQMLARSISRILYQTDPRYKLTALDILQGYKQDEPTKEAVRKAAKIYEKEIGCLLQYNPDNTGTNATRIIDYINNEARKAISAGKPAPNICIDYLQILTAEKGEDPVEGIKRTVAELKNYAKKYNAIVIAIMAQNRMANESDEPTLSAGRDTSALEYTADLQLQLIKASDKDKNAKKYANTIKKDESIISLSVTKSRFTQSDINHKIYFTFKGGQSLFEKFENESEEIDNPFEVTDGKRPRL